jgi:hypothetical protein
VLTNVCFLADTRPLCDDSIDVDVVLSKLNQCSSDPNFDLRAFFAAHAVKFDVSLTCEDVMSHFLNGQCVGQKAPRCHEVAHDVRSPTKMALATTEAVVVSCERKQISLDKLRVCCSVVGVATTRQPEYAIPMQKLNTRCNALRPLLDCDGLETIFCGVEDLGKQSLQYLSAQHNLNADPERDADFMKVTVLDHITSGECQASTSSLCARRWVKNSETSRPAGIKSPQHRKGFSNDRAE